MWRARAHRIKASHLFAVSLNALTIKSQVCEPCGRLLFAYNSMEVSSCSLKPLLFLCSAHMAGVYSIMTKAYSLVRPPYIFLYSSYTVGMLFAVFTTPPRIFFCLLLLLKKCFKIIKAICACCKEYEKSAEKNKEGN